MRTGAARRSDAGGSWRVKGGSGSKRSRIVQPEGEWVVVQVTALPICGSDRHVFEGRVRTGHGGHEGVGIVAAAQRGARVRGGSGRDDAGFRLQPLLRSACAATISTAGRSRPRRGISRSRCSRRIGCAPLPDDLTFEQGSLVGCALCPGMGAARRMGMGRADTVLITESGAGRDGRGGGGALPGGAGNRRRSGAVAARAGVGVGCGGGVLRRRAGSRGAAARVDGW